MIAILPKYAASQVVGFIKGEGAVDFSRAYAECKGRLVGRYFRE